MDVALRTADIFSILNTSIAKEYTNTFLELEIPNAGLLDIENIRNVYNLGYNQAMNKKDELIKMFY